MKEFPFDDLPDGKMTIKIDDRETNTYIEKTIDPSDWKEILQEVVHMVNGCGYVINPIKTEKAFYEISSSCTEEYLKDE